MLQKILVALDKSTSRRSVFEEALALAKALQANLTLLHVLSTD
ncbi:MAG: universal stress protein [Aulosira sp. ZfuVER01]|nr:universal stress protein [Aulosira sp. ZfuVER01]MDZ8000201.1 universal stress protein [Aulosira sp. DedVER01a]MDZ8053431.1 universal stress protein [Aulosira sp. ZfuCHP01]